MAQVSSPQKKSKSPNGFAPEGKGVLTRQRQYISGFQLCCPMKKSDVCQCCTNGIGNVGRDFVGDPSPSLWFQI